jgi:3-oxoacyl-(acyl-carrier-protein) synthase
MTFGGLGLVTAWGVGLAALPADARVAAAGRDVLTMPTPARSGDRYRRSTRESLLALAAVDELRASAGLAPGVLAGERTALVYATAAAYAASNRGFIESPGAVYFPYTAPSAVPAEVAIELELRGAYLTFVGGPEATHEAVRHAGRLLRDGECDRALVLAVETFADSGHLFRRGRWLLGRPLVEAAACAVLLPGADVPAYDAATARRRAGETLACGPLIALGLAASAMPGA